MTVTTTQMYFLVMLDSFSTCFVIMWLVIAVSTLFYMLFCGLDDNKPNKKILNFAVASFLFFLSLSTVVPSTKQACAIIIAPKIINNEQVQEMPNKVIELGSAWLEELKPSKAQE